MATTSRIDGQAMSGHYRRMLAAREAPAGGGFESFGAVESPEADLSRENIDDRTESARESLHRIVERYLNNDPKLLEIVEEIIKQGGEALRMLADDNFEAITGKPQAFEGLEAIVRTDGSRPSFLIREGVVDRESSPIGGWGDLLDTSADNLGDAIACVGRIDVPGAGLGFQGTGFLIREDLIVTNRHVLQLSARQDNEGNWSFVHDAAINFGHELKGRESLNRRRLKRVVFCGSKEIEFSTIDHKKLDLALIELEPGDAAAAAPRRVFSLDLASGWAQPGTKVYTVGYPGPPPVLAYPPTLLEQLFQSTYGHKRLAPGEIISSPSALQRWTLAHDATTLGGNSGSIVLMAGSEGLAAGLHYGGRTIEPRENWGHVLGSVLDETDGRSSRTLRELLTGFGIKVAEGGRPAVTPEGGPFTPIPEPIGRGMPPATPARAAGGEANGIQPRRPVRGWRQGITLATMRPLTAVPGATRMEAVGLEAAGDGVTAAESFANRGGYAPDALDGWEIPLPMPSGDMRPLRRGGAGAELRYEHFSVIMSASRRMPLITACNINGAESRRLPRIDRWNYDGRLDKDDQWGNELYRGNDADRGHMVRREDPVWGPLAVAKRANVDTFHYTNSCPQMAGVNQVTWLGLEDYILNHTREDNMRVSVFTGPFFTDQDFPYRGALIPKAFWKVVAFLTDDGRPSATAYKVSQARELQELEFVFAGYKTFQISVQQVMDATGINFGALIPFDGFSQHERVHGVVLTEQLERLDQIRV